MTTKLTVREKAALRHSFINGATQVWIYGPHMTKRFRDQLIAKELLIVNERRQSALTDLAKKLHAELGYTGKEL